MEFTMSAGGKTPMEKIQIGSSDLSVPKMGVGVMPWSDSRGFGYGSRLGLEEARGPFAACIASGMTFFDTAEMYGFGRSERILGELVRGESTPVSVATKYAPVPWRFGSRAVVAALKRSLNRLGLERVDLYQIHFPSRLGGIASMVNGLAEAAEAGLTRAVGVSNFSAAQMREAHAILAKRGVPLAANQVEYSLLKRSPESNGVLDACRELDVTLIAYSPLGRGALSGKYRPGAGPADLRRRRNVFKDETLERLTPLLDAMREIGAAHGDRSPAQVALNWLIRLHGVLPIPGAKDAAQARDNAAAAGFSMSADEAARLDTLSHDVLNTSR
jgi:aryl-alcohol dehydrogenase-like predicted oxidoreductase